MLGPSGRVSKILDAAEETVDMITDLVNQITIEIVIPAECKLL